MGLAVRERLVKTKRNSLSNMTDMTDTVGPIFVIPHTPNAMAKSVSRIVDEGVTVVSINPLGHMMGVLFSDGKDALYWYRSPKNGSSFGVN